MNIQKLNLDRLFDALAAHERSVLYEGSHRVIASFEYDVEIRSAIQSEMTIGSCFAAFENAGNK